jgi:hypothetical protein
MNLSQSTDSLQEKPCTPPRCEIELWSTERLVPYEHNPRKNDGAVDQMVASIQEFGFKIPVLARSDGQVVDGHLRLKAALRLRSSHPSLSGTAKARQMSAAPSED